VNLLPRNPGRDGFRTHLFADKGYDAQQHRDLSRRFGAEPHIHKDLLSHRVRDGYDAMRVRAARPVMH
jgi:transposase